MHLRAIGIGIGLALVAGCGGSGQDGNGAGDMAASGPTCATMGMDVAAYTGQAAGALALAGPVVKSFAPDATLAGIVGQGITLNGINAQTWDVNFYSPSLKHNFIGAYNTTSGHVGCQDVTIKIPPPVEPDPVTSSMAVAQTVVARIMQDAPGAKLPGTTQGFIYGQFTVGGGAPRDHVWGVTLLPWVVVVDDATNTVLECTNNTAPCN